MTHCYKAMQLLEVNLVKAGRKYESFYACLVYQLSVQCARCRPANQHMEVNINGNVVGSESMKTFISSGGFPGKTTVTGDESVILGVNQTVGRSVRVTWA